MQSYCTALSNTLKIRYFESVTLTTLSEGRAWIFYADMPWQVYSYLKKGISKQGRAETLWRAGGQIPKRAHAKKFLTILVIFILNIELLFQTLQILDQQFNLNLQLKMKHGALLQTTFTWIKNTTVQKKCNFTYIINTVERAISNCT